MSRVYPLSYQMFIVFMLTALLCATAVAGGLRAGDPALQKWTLADEPPYPAGNKPNQARIELGKMLFFDPRLSGDGNMSCATCHSPMFGWSDGLATARGHHSMVLGRASPTIINTAYNKTQMWDGRKRSLEDQAMGPMEANTEMAMDIPKLFKMLNTNEGYVSAFNEAYPGEKIDGVTIAKALASFERTIISNNSPFDRWIKGDPKAMTKQQVRGFSLFLDQNKGNCAACHQAPNFADNGFHNIGVAAIDGKEADVGRFSQVPLKRMKGAFKTPTLRDVERTAPYMHNGSVANLMDVMKLYAEHGINKDNVSDDLNSINLNEQEMLDIVAFMQALTGPPMRVLLPVLPLD